MAWLPCSLPVTASRQPMRSALASAEDSIPCCLSVCRCVSCCCRCSQVAWNWEGRALRACHVASTSRASVVWGVRRTDSCMPCSKSVRLKVMVKSIIPSKVLCDTYQKQGYVITGLQASYGKATSESPCQCQTRKWCSVSDTSTVTELTPVGLCLPHAK